MRCRCRVCTTCTAVKGLRAAMGPEAMEKAPILNAGESPWVVYTVHEEDELINREHATGATRLVSRWVHAHVCAVAF